MTRLWKSSVAILLGLATITSATAVEPGAQRTAAGTGVRRANNTTPPGTWQFFNNQSAPNAGNVQAARMNQMNQQAAQMNQAVQPAARMNQVAAQNQNGVLQAQGVNRVPGQGAVAPQQNNLAANQQAQPVVNADNVLDQFGAPIQRALQHQALNQQLQNAQQGQSDLSPARNLDQALATTGIVSSTPVGSGSVSSTVEESILTGQARTMQSAGEYNRNTAEGLKTLELARAIALDNARNALKTYLELKDINANYQAKKRGMPLTKEQLDEWNRQDQPERLTRAEYNADTGAIRWPDLLQTVVFADHRIALEEMFARRAANEFGPKSDFYREVAGNTHALKERLKSYLRSNEKFFTDEEYVAAQNFLSSLAHEARTAPALDGLVAN